MTSNPKPRYLDISGSASQYFTGRDDVLDTLHKYFQSPLRRNPQVAVLAGLGGIGKTQIALQYAEKTRENYIGVFFIDATNEQEIKAAFARIARIVITEELSRYPGSNHDEVANNLGFAGLVNNPSRDPLIENYNRIVDAVKRFFARLNSLFLLIFDGADEPTGVGIDCFMPYRTLGDIIITTRDIDTQVFGHLFSIEEMSEDSAIDLLYRTSGRAENKKNPLSEAKAIVNELGRLPLALELAGGYLSSTGIQFKHFLRTYNSHSKDILSVTPRAGYRKSVFATWEMSFEKLHKTNSKATSLLQILSFMYLKDSAAAFWDLEGSGTSMPHPPDPADTQVTKSLENGLSDQHGQWMLHSDTYILRQAFSSLTKLCMIKRMLKEDVYDIHPVVHLWARERLDEKAQSLYAKDALFMVARALHHLDGLGKSASWIQQRRLLPHIQTCWQHVQRFLSNGTLHFSNPIGTAISIFARAHTSQGNYAIAEEMFRLVLKNQKEIMSPLSLETLTTMDRLAYLCDNRGELEEAQKLYEQVLKGREEVLGEANAATLETVNDLAGVYEYQGQLAKAEEHYKRALEGRERVLGLEHPDVLQTVADFAGLCDHQGRVSEGRALHQRALVGREKVLGPDHPDTLSSVLEVGGLYWSIGELDEAEKL